MTPRAQGWFLALGLSLACWAAGVWLWHVLQVVDFASVIAAAAITAGLFAIAITPWRGR